MSDPIVIAPYDPKWVVRFEEECERILDAFSDLRAQIEHIGSTAVPGLAAKPIIDILIMVYTAEDAIRAITPLVRLGYTCYGEAEIPGRIYFDRRAYEPCHLHLYVQGNPAIERHLLFRDYLRAHPDARDAYAELKRGLAEKFRNDRPTYTEAKTEFVRDIEARAREERANGRL
ncbi:MAG: GrpB family protein [Chloroflexi bacterium]|nr:GrpB family protein [Chloroflexota bacterium]